MSETHGSHLSVTVRVSGIKAFRLLLWELRMLHDRMRVEASPHAEALERALERFIDEAEPVDVDRDPATE